MESRRPSPSLHRVTPTEIRRRGFAWPPSGVAESAYLPDAEGLVDLDHVLNDLRVSLAARRREHDAARQQTARATRESWEAHDEAKAGRVSLGAAIGDTRDAIAEVERMTAHLDRTAARAKAWRRGLVGIYLLTALVGLGVHLGALGATPSDLGDLAWSDGMTEADAVAEAIRLRKEVHESLPGAASWLAPLALFSFDDRVQSVIAPNRWVRESTSLRERVYRVDPELDAIVAEYRATAALMVAVFGMGLLFGALYALRPRLPTAFAICLPPLCTTSVATERLLGVDNSHLLVWTLPMALAAAGLLIMETARALKTGLAGPRGDSWAYLTWGLFLVLIGTGVTLLGIALAIEVPGASVLATAVVPALYGLVLVGRGLWGLVRRPKG